jgi:hypothetical protein
MGEVIGRQWTKETAPRNGTKPGRHHKINKSAWNLIEEVLADHKEHGAEVITFLRLEKPEAYERLALAATEIALKYTQQGQQAGALVQISINRFFPDKELVTIDGADDQPSA